MNSEQDDGVRLQKVLSRAGVASRRAAEDLIAQGRVKVDGAVVTEFGRRVDPDSVVIHVDDVRVVVHDGLVYLAFNKPRGVHTTMSDDRGRPCVGDYIRNRDERLFHVGRLDAETEGLLLLTNDGDLAHRLMHPSFVVSKTYLAEVPAPVPRAVGRRLREGIDLDDGPATVDSFRVVDSHGGRAMVEVELHEGRNHIVRRLLAAVDLPVRTLVRTQIGDVHLGGQRSGSLRALTRQEVGSLFAVVDL
jgi:23S rRNA pseudouridine2605 synthase